MPMKAVIPAAGRGTRLAPLTLGIPKALLPLGRRPAIDFLLEEAETVGLREIGVVVNPSRPAVREYLTDSVQQGRFSALSFSFFEQPEPKGLGDALLRAADFAGDKPFALMLPDTVGVCRPSPLDQLLEVFRTTDHPCIGLTRARDGRLLEDSAFDLRRLRRGVHRITRIHLRGAPPNPDRGLRGIGRYILTPAIFPPLTRAGIEAVGEFDESAGLTALVEKGELLGVRIVGRVYDIGSHEGYRRALRDLLLAGR